MGQLFGTDGIRGRANTYPMIPEIALNVGRAVAILFKPQSGDARIIIGKDPRISGSMIEHALVSGICSMGGKAFLCDILPTPGVAHIVKNIGYDAGIMISASHNPYFDNGIKLFRGNGHKLSDSEENEIEKLVLDSETPRLCELIKDPGQVDTVRGSGSCYLDFLKSIPENSMDLSTHSFIFDCSNGATSSLVPRLFTHFNANFEIISHSPNGKNINDQCGSQFTKLLEHKVVKSSADAGFAFDGDGDRLIAVDERGQIVSGDQLIAIAAKYAKDNGQLTNNRVVTTVMSNIGLCEVMNKMGVEHIMADVGDREVVKQMLKSGSVIGGEDSGHIIFLDHHTTGDGMLSCLKIIEIMKKTGRSLSELAGIMTVFPQVLINIDVNDKPDISMVPEIRKVISHAEQDLGKRGRVLVRYSGTQPLCRVMVEGPSLEITRGHCEKIAGAIRSVIGS